MSESRTPADARRAVDEMEEKIVNEPEAQSRRADADADEKKTGPEPTEQSVPGTEEPPD